MVSAGDESGLNQELPQADGLQHSTKETTPSRPAGFIRAVSVVTEEEINYSTASPPSSPVDSELPAAEHVHRMHTQHQGMNRYGQSLFPAQAASVDNQLQSEEPSYARTISWSHVPHQKHRRLQRSQTVESLHISNLNDVTRILHKMAQAIQSDMFEEH